MVRYIAFLRAINVGGKKLTKMEELRKVFETLRLKNVRTYIQSGNVIFDARETNSNALATQIEWKIHESLGYEVNVLLRTIAEIEEILKRNPFKRIEPHADIMMFVSFMSEEPTNKPRLPLVSSTEKLEVFAVKDRTAFILSKRKKNGWFGFPNNFVEKQLGVIATTRNWTTVRKILDFAEQGLKPVTVGPKKPSS